ncbi:MAG: YebC/PmpR family DNA-binding transcriptional regulator, partial [Coxiellaceae bacterium]|nr:YebC/PmpR family DNA-binding transcriptional regulator [Coxiellaceae bacterium]
SIDVTTTAEDFMTVKETLIAAELKPEGAEVTMIASTEVALDDEDQAAKMIRLSDMLEDLDDVQNVYSNANIDEAILEKL